MKVSAVCNLRYHKRWPSDQIVIVTQQSKTKRVCHFRQLIWTTPVKSIVVNELKAITWKLNGLDKYQELHFNLNIAVSFYFGPLQCNAFQHKNLFSWMRKDLAAKDIVISPGAGAGSAGGGAGGGLFPSAADFPSSPTCPVITVPSCYCVGFNGL